MTELAVVLVSAPSEEKAAEMAKILVQERLVACVNLLPQVRSIYSWEGKLCDEKEVLMILKTRVSAFEALRARVVALHPYECPEIVCLPVEEVHRPYLEWAISNVRP